MRKILLIVVSLVLLTAGTASAVKPENPGGDKFDAEAAIQAETDARIAADGDLQNQIYHNVLDISDNAAKIQANTEAINSSIGGVKVYDNSGQYLGLLMGIGFPSDPLTQVYIPTFKRFLFIDLNNGKPYVTPSFIYYLNADCTGQAYTDINNQYRIINNNESLYIGDMTTPVNITYKSRKYGNVNVCENETVSRSAVIPIHEVTLPFTMPVALPIHFE